VSWRQFLYLFFSSSGKGTISIGFLSEALPSVLVGVEAVRLAEPVVEDVKVNKQMLADANKLMRDASFKGMKVVASLAGFVGIVLSVAVSPDGHHIVFGSVDNLVKVWSVSGGMEVASLARHTGYVCSDGQHIVSGSWDELVKVWSVSGGKEVASLAGHTNFVCSVAFSPDGQHIVSGSLDNMVKVWSVSGGKEVASLAGHEK
jgi:WD40 repeat protein